MEFTATSVAGVPLPLPSSGEWGAKLAGTMKIHGTERPLVWDLKITRSGTETRAGGATSFRFSRWS